jgi:site-specific recombinase XerD
MEDKMNAYLSMVIEKYLDGERPGMQGIVGMRYYKDTLHDFLNFTGDIKIEILTNEHIQRYIANVATRPRKAGEISIILPLMHYNVLRNFVLWMDFYRYNKIFKTGPVKFPQSVLGMPDALTNRETKRLVLYLAKKGDFQEKFLVEILLHTGLSVTELTDLNLDDINLEIGTIKIKNKDGIAATHTIKDTLKSDLSAYIQNHRRCVPSEKALFTNCSGNRLEPEDLNMMIKKTLCKIRKDGNCDAETLRNTFALSMFKN